MEKHTKEISESQIRILTLFTDGFNQEFYVKEVAEKLSISPRTSQLNLEELEKKAILESKTRGKIKLYKLQDTYQADNHLQITEIYKKIIFCKKNNKMQEIIDQIAQSTNGIIIIFGSFAKGKERKDSDLDLCIIGKYNRGVINEISQIYNQEINIKQYTSKEYSNNIGTDTLLQEVRKSHIIYKGIEEALEVMRR
ncbi:MAG: putative nucleotidyltransferase [Patescibacteria group bacterium]|jgi:predicted nucleotidyltransferase